MSISNVARELLGISNIAGGRQSEEALLCVFGKLITEPSDKGAHALSIHLGAPSKRLELLVGRLDAVHSHHRLDGLGEHLVRAIDDGENRAREPRARVQGL